MRLRDFHSGDRAEWIRVGVWSVVGGVIGAFMGFIAASTGRYSTSTLVAIGFVVGSLIVFTVVTTLGGAAGRVMASIFNPSGRSTRGKSELSLAESLVVRGRYGEAAAEYRRQAELAPADPEPRMRLARLYRDRLDDNGLAAQWFRLARDAATDPAIELMAIREIVELFEKKLGTPERALPDLARWLDVNAEAAGADWARRELTRLRASVRDTRAGP